MPSRRTPILVANFITSLGHPPPDLDFITDSLAVGGALRSDEQIRGLPGLGITSVVDLRSESLDNVAELERLGIHFLHLPTPDWNPLTPEDMQTGTQWVLDEMAKGNKVLVHCQHGIGRSVILVAAVLVKQGYAWQEAMRLIQAKRVGAGPHADQLEALAAFAKGQKKTAQS